MVVNLSQKFSPCYSNFWEGQMPNRKNRKCVNLQCDKPQHAKSLCRSHYEALHYNRWKQARRLRERELRASENSAIDPDDFWEWVKVELKITT